MSTQETKLALNRPHSKSISPLAQVFIGVVAFAACGFAMSVPLWAQNGEPLTGGSTVSRTDSFEIKMNLLQEAWKRGDFDLARSLTHSLRDTVVQTQVEKEPPSASVIDTGHYLTVNALAKSGRQWAQGWKYYKVLTVTENVGETRRAEPVEVSLSFPSDQVSSLRREIRLARIENDKLVEVPSQVFNELRRGNECSCTILWMMDSLPKQTQSVVVFYGNPAAESPEYPSDLATEGEGFGLDISNAYFKASLSRQTGQLERLILRREHGLELFSGGEGHGEPAGIDWAHDYVDEGHFQKLRVSLWGKCPDYEVIKGPLCTIVRRWGFPYSPVHPIYAPARLKVHVEYRFYSGLPWFHKSGTMEAVQTFHAAALRDDEWVFSGHSFTDQMWMGRDGKLQFGNVAPEQQDDLWGVGFYNRNSKDSFMALFLQHYAEGLPELKHSGAPTLSYRWHGQLWSRYPLPVQALPKGAVLHQKNAYLSIPFEKPDGVATIEKMRRSLISPLTVSSPSNQGNAVSLLSGLAAKDSTASGRLARQGETSETSGMKRQIWEALHDCKDAQLYTADISIVDLGLVYDVRVRGDVVTVVMAMPHRGRPLAEYFANGSISVHSTKSVPIRERLLQIPGIRNAVVEQTWEPGWNSNRLTQNGRKKLGLPE